MPRVVTIHQPDFIPWLGFFHRLWISDVFIVLDDAQFLRRGWHHRDKIKTPVGGQWLTLPVKKKGRFKQRIRDVELEDPSRKWKQKHLDTIRHNYSKTAYFDELYPNFESLYLREEPILMQFNLKILQWMAGLMDLRFEPIFASYLPSKLNGSRRLIELCQWNYADVYLTGQGSKNYLEENLFVSQDIRVHWQIFLHPQYPQQHGNFVPMLSSLDYLFNCGPGNPFQRYE